MGGTSRGADEFPEDITATIRRIERIIAGERARGVRKVALVGLSQGGAVVASMYMASNARLAGVVQLSGWLPDAFAGPETMALANVDVPLLMVHGSEDDVIEVDWARDMVEVMRGRGRVVDEKILDGVGHAFGKSIFTAIKYTIKYLKERL